MIFVTLGTQDKSFTRLLKILDAAINNGIIKDKVIVQAGCTKYESKNMEIIKYLGEEDYSKYIRECDLFITHAGVGSIFNALKYNKKIMAIARLEKYKEHVNDHQLELLNEFVNEGYILSFEDYDTFVDNYKKLDSYNPNTYESNTNNFINIIKEFIGE